MGYSGTLIVSSDGTAKGAAKTDGGKEIVIDCTWRRRQPVLSRLGFFFRFMEPAPHFRPRNAHPRQPFTRLKYQDHEAMRTASGTIGSRSFVTEAIIQECL